MSTHFHMETSPHFWLGYLASSIASATQTDTDPKAMLRQRLAEFLETRPAGDELGDRLRVLLGEGDPQ